MNLISRIAQVAGFRAEGTHGPLDDFWYGPAGGMASATGMRVTAETAMKLSAVWRCVAIISGSVAMLPLKVYQRRTDGGGDAAPNHPLYDLLYGSPNTWQTSYEFRRMMQQHLLLRGNAYARIVPGPRGPVDQLIPLHPDAVTPEQQPDMSIRYKVRMRTGNTETLYQDEVFHLLGLTDDGVKGMAVLDYARESMGLGLAQEQYGARFFSQGGTPPGVLLAKGKLKPETQEHIANSWMKATAGVARSHRWPVLEEGFDIKQLAVGLTAEQAQMVESRSFTVTDIARWFGLPPHMVGETTGETSWGSGIEQLSMGFVRWALMDWLTMWEHRIAFSLILAPRTYYAKFTVNALERGDLKARSEALAIQRQNGIITADEWRALEDMNPAADGHGDERWMPVNYAVVGAEPAPLPQPTPPPNPGALAETVPIYRNGVAGGH